MTQTITGGGQATGGPTGDGGFWVFAYGSLMWMPGFEVAEARLARLPDYRRAFALSSIHYRGTPERPGLVLGLDWRPGADCLGMALRVGAEGADQVRRYLAERELVTKAYFEVLHRAMLVCDGPGQGEPVPVLCYILDRTHRQYAGHLGLDEQAAIIAGAEGPSGPNRDYLFRTVARLRDIGIEDPELAELERLVRARTG